MPLHALTTDQLRHLDGAASDGRLYRIEFQPDDGNLTLVYGIFVDYFRDVIAPDGTTIMTGYVNSPLSERNALP